MTTTLTINGVDYSDYIYDWKSNDESIYKVSEANVYLADPDNTISDAIERYQEIKIWEDGTLIFTNIIVTIDDGAYNSQILDIYCQDYWFFFLRAPHTKAYVDKTASYILNDMITTNQDLKDLGFTVTGIVSTTILHNKSYQGKACSDIATQLAIEESFTVFVDKNKDVVFRGQTAVDSGVHLNYANNDIRSEDFQRTGLGMVNVCRVRGKPGSPPASKPVASIYEDEELINKYRTATFNGRIPMQEINAPELTTPQQCRDRGEFEVRKRNEDPKRATIKTDLDVTLDVGELVTLTIAHKSITAQTFFIQSRGHNFSKNETTLNVLYYTRTNADLVQAILDKAISTSQYLSDSSVTFSKFKTFTENITILSYLDIDRRVVSGAEYGSFDYSDKYYGQLSGNYISEQADQQVIVTNKMFETLLSVIAQINGPPNSMTSSNAYIAIGNGSTVIKVSDTTLENETFREGMEAGYPNASDDAEVTFQAIIDDVTVINSIITNLGIFNASSVGDYQAGIVLDTSVSKSEDEEIRLSWRFNISGAEMTVLGLNLLRDLYVTFVTDYLDNSNAAIEITTTAPTTYREGMETSHPEFVNTVKDSLRFQIDISGADISGAGLDGEEFIDMDLYNKTSAGTKVLDGTVSSATFSVLEDLIAQIILKLNR